MTISRPISRLGRSSVNIEGFAAAATLLVIATMSLPLFLQAQPQKEITLRFVDYETGQPIKKVGVTAVWWNGIIPPDGVITPAIQKIVSKVSSKTGSDGVIRLSLPTPAPEHLEVSSPFDTVDGVDAQLIVREVMENGTCVIADADNSPNSKLLPGTKVPGEVVIFTRKLTARDRITREFP